jgi:thiamine-monophosphate kinase
MEEPVLPKLTNIQDLGEFGLIEHLTDNIKLTDETSVKGVGDDAAVVRYASGDTLVSTDMYVEGVHFDIVYTPLMHLGYKCITGSISDIYAMNGMAKQVLVSLAMSSRFTVEAMDELYEGIRIACKVYGVDLVGGDTTSSKSGLVINVTAIGVANKEDICYRDGAKSGDIICVSGDLGGAYVGLQVLEREKRVYLEAPGAQPELSGFDYVLKRQLRPEARKDIVEILKAAGVKPTAMIDISDGLASEIMHICKQSNAGCMLFEDEIPIDENTYNTALSFNIDPSLCALSGGEDYELLFTVSGTDYEKIKNNPDITAIGHITEKEKGCQFKTKSANIYPLEAQGWKHF